MGETRSKAFELACIICMFNTLIRLKLVDTETVDDLATQLNMMLARSHEAFEELYGGKYERYRQR